MLRVVSEYCEQPDGSAAARCLACGVCPLAQGVAINVRQLRLLLQGCKSSINGSFQQLGCVTLPLRGAALDELLSKLPSLRGNFAELREWSVRTFRVQLQLPTAETLGEEAGAWTEKGAADLAEEPRALWPAPLFEAGGFFEWDA
jgi:hypothetical protein